MLGLKFGVKLQNNWMRFDSGSDPQFLDVWSDFEMIGEASVTVPGSSAPWNVWREGGAKKVYLPKDGGVHDSS